ncbi:methyltransferase domain-containing protein, partial [Pelagibacteraceae bacterium]|nr:methyltransferase domain-containing protein [Pelagibacteraceae bacterium]
MKRELINTEYELFDNYSNEWWDENGKFKILHQIRPIRVRYILDQINNNSPKNLDILDLGCGGGLVSESLSRLGANVTGVDFVKNNI